MSDKLNIVDARQALQRRKERASSGDQLIKAPDLFDLGGRSLTESADRKSLALLETTPAPLPLDAYLASALTCLSDNERGVIFGISDLVSKVCKENGIDLYEPRKRTDPLLHADVSASDVYAWDKHSV